MVDERGDEMVSDEALYTDAVSAMESGDEHAKRTVAFYKLLGKGTKVDTYGAVDLLEELALKGDTEAMWMLGLCCEYGMGIKVDIERAELLYCQSKQARNAVGYFLSNCRGSDRGTDVLLVSGS